jgi:EmrB/QacA subfamily drug resistance transporter
VELFNDCQEEPMRPETAPAPDPRRWLILALVVVAQFMVVLDVAIVNVALPSIQDDLHFSQDSLQWVITSYSILFGGVLLLGGRLADLLGRRRLFMAGLVLFTVFSLLDGLAWNETSLIVFRAAQGLGAALLSPAALSILTTTFEEGRERNLALGIWGAASGSGGAAGVLLGGALTSWFSWSWIFYLNVPIGIVVLIVTPFLLGETRAVLAHRSLDLPGAVSITGGTMLLVYGMTRATEHGWGSGLAVASFAAAAVLLVSFVAIEARTKAPLLPLRLFRLRTLSGSNVAGLLLGAAVFSQFFLLTLYMQQVLHYSPLKTGVAYIALTLAIIAFSGVAQSLALRVGVRRVLAIGMVLSAAGLVLYGRLPPDGHYFWDVFPAFLLSGIGLAMAFVPMTIGALTGVEPEDAGVASGLINTGQQVGGAIGVALATTLATTYTGHYVTGHPGSTAFSPAALTHGFSIAFYVLAGISIAAGVFSWLIMEPSPPGVATAEEATGTTEATLAADLS